MLYLIPAPAHRAALRFAHGLRVRWWRVRKPRLIGCRVLVFDQEDRLLLIRHSYGTSKWMPPGGGVARGEDPLAAAARELHEETACRLDFAVLLTVSNERLSSTVNEVHVVAGQTGDKPRPDLREVLEARFFHTHALPEYMPSMFRERLPEWITAAKAARRPDAADPPGRSPAPTG